MKDLPTIARPVEIATIGATPSIKRVEMNEREREALASALGLVHILALSAEFAVSRDRDRVICLDGRMKAEIIQNCVLSLEPVRQELDEPIELSFVEAEPHPQPESATVDIGPTEHDPPETVSGPIIDLGAITVEHFVLAIDPYPRAPGAEAPDNPARDSQKTGDSPFAMLAPLAGRRSTER